MPCTRNGTPSSAGASSLEHADERLADALALDLGILDPGELFEEALARVDVHERDAEVVAERGDDLLPSPSRSSPWSTNTQVS